MQIAPEHVTRSAPWILAIGSLLVLLYDSYAVATAGRWPTISEQFRETSAAYPILPFALGLLIGHLLWPGHK